MAFNTQYNQRKLHPSQSVTNNPFWTKLFSNLFLFHFRSVSSNKFKQAYIWKLENIRNTTNEQNQGVKLYVLTGNIQESSIKLVLVPKSFWLSLKDYLKAQIANKSINRLAGSNLIT
jgi:hypothetical protein